MKYSRQGPLYLPSNGRRLVPPKAVDVPTAAHHPPQRRPQLVEVNCPRCGVRFATRYGYGAAVCMADAPPYTGPGRGCGWLLKIEPIGTRLTVEGSTSQALSLDDVTDVTPIRNRIPNQKKMRRGMNAIWENWRRRGLVPNREINDAQADIRSMLPKPPD